MGWFSKFKKKSAEIEATEGQIAQTDPLTGTVTTNRTKTIRKNNFQTYSSQVNQILKNYNATSEYGPTMTKAVIDMRTAFICGGGITVKTKPASAQAWVDSFMKVNKLNGSKFQELVELEEKEGKSLIILKREGTGPDAPIRIKLQPWTAINYEIDTDIYGDPVVATLADGGNGPRSPYQKESFVYIHVGGCLNDINISPPRIASCLTQIENYERGLYDLRENNHLYGRSTPLINTKDKSDANYMQAKINKENWTIGKYLIGPFTAGYLIPDQGALATLSGEMGLNAKIISSVTGLPVHWIGWTDLMSNRATAETLDELIKFATKKERTYTIEGMDELIQKAAAKARNGGQAIPEFELEIELPNITSADLKALIEVFQPLWLDKIISKQTLQGMVPGINPEKENKQIEKEAKEDELKRPEVVEEFEETIPEDANE